MSEEKNEIAVVEDNIVVADKIEPTESVVETKEIVENKVLESDKVIEFVAPNDQIVEDKTVVSETKEDPNEGIFITEKDTFDVTIKWYKINDDLFIDDSDTEFDADNGNINKFTVTFKFPSQGDHESILNSTSYRSPDEMKISDIIQMELTRLVVLVRKWSLQQDISRMVEMDPMIIKSMLKKIRDKIGMKGIL